MKLNTNNYSVFLIYSHLISIIKYHIEVIDSETIIDNFLYCQHQQNNLIEISK